MIRILKIYYYINKLFIKIDLVYPFELLTSINILKKKKKKKKKKIIIIIIIIIKIYKNIIYIIILFIK